MKYKSKTTNNIVTVIDKIGTGMCSKTLGMTLVIFKFEDDLDFHRVMEHREFYAKYEEVKQHYTQRLLVRIVADLKALTYQTTRMLNIDNSLNKPLNQAIIFTNCQAQFIMDFLYTILPVFILPLLYIIYKVMCWRGDRKDKQWLQFNKGLHWRDYLD